ncbi:hypothetical protein OS493_032074 [Desmophyllum pertusum]|uniref:Uncharacterized protein n=1 Tax=Desmophyllum pertusum TaxID=174260 RepID=A0A9W9YYT0_9CNID|nr:hypothetical protein OS493_032074 [Desmophyllum pertusum]
MKDDFDVSIVLDGSSDNETAPIATVDACHRMCVAPAELIALTGLVEELAFNERLERLSPGGIVTGLLMTDNTPLLVNGFSPRRQTFEGECVGGLCPYSNTPKSAVLGWCSMCEIKKSQITKVLEARSSSREGLSHLWMAGLLIL